MTNTYGLQEDPHRIIAELRQQLAAANAELERVRGERDAAYRQAEEDIRVGQLQCKAMNTAIRERDEARASIRNAIKHPECPANIKLVLAAPQLWAVAKRETDAALATGRSSTEYAKKFSLDEPDCIKVPHIPGGTGYMHGPDDDGPYNVDGVEYCGRCHCVWSPRCANGHPPAGKAGGVLWSFRCEARRLEDGHYRVSITGLTSGEVRESVGYHPLWELIRLLAATDANHIAREAVKG